MEVGGGCIYQSFGLVQFVLWALKEATAIVFPLAFDGSAWAVTLGKKQTEWDSLAWWSLSPNAASLVEFNNVLANQELCSCRFPGKAKGEIPTARGIVNNGLSKCSCEVQSMDVWACGQSWLWACSAP